MTINGDAMLIRFPQRLHSKLIVCPQLVINPDLLNGCCSFPLFGDKQNLITVHETIMAILFGTSLALELETNSGIG